MIFFPPDQIKTPYLAFRSFLTRPYLPVSKTFSAPDVFRLDEYMLRNDNGLHPAHLYMAYIPQRIDYDDPAYFPFGFDKRLPPIERTSERTWRVKQDYVERNLRYEAELLNVLSVLSDEARLFAFGGLDDKVYGPPSITKFDEEIGNKAQLIGRLHGAVGLFVILLAKISYCINHLQYNPEVERRRRWYDLLMRAERRYVPMTIIDRLLASNVWMESLRRMGGWFVYMYRVPPNLMYRLGPATRWNMPLYMELDIEQIKNRAKYEKTEEDDILPPVHEILEALRKEPRAYTEWEYEQKKTEHRGVAHTLDRDGNILLYNDTLGLGFLSLPAPLPLAGSGQLKGEHFWDFIHRMVRVFDKWFGSLSDEERERWEAELNRRKAKYCSFPIPDKSDPEYPKIYEWNIVNENWIRGSISIPNARRKYWEVDDHSDKRYDARKNEIDICGEIEFASQLEKKTVDADYGAVQMTEAFRPTLFKPLVEYDEPMETSYGPIVSYESNSNSELLDLKLRLQIVLGFLPPRVPLATMAGDSDWRGISMDLQHNEILPREGDVVRHIGSVNRFLQPLKGKPPKEGSYALPEMERQLSDLHKDSPFYVKKTKSSMRPMYLTTANEEVDTRTNKMNEAPRQVSWYVILPTSEAYINTSYYFAVQGATAAIACVRHCTIRKGEAPIAMKEAVRFLSRNGFVVRTMRSLEPAPKLYKTNPSLPYRLKFLGERPLNHRFTQREYLEYDDILRGLFRRPHFRAALGCGGIVWRIAQMYLENESFVDGPSFMDKTLPLNERRLSGLCLGKEFTNLVVYDDKLSEREMNMICGVYYVEFRK